MMEVHLLGIYWRETFIMVSALTTIVLTIFLIPPTVVSIVFMLTNSLVTLQIVLLNNLLAEIYPINQIKYSNYFLRLDILLMHCLSVLAHFFILS